MNKQISDEDLAKAIYEYVGTSITYPDYTILNITTYVQGNKIINIIRYSKDNQLYSKKIEAVWSDEIDS